MQRGGLSEPPTKQWIELVMSVVAVFSFSPYQLKNALYACRERQAAAASAKRHMAKTQDEQMDEWLVQLCCDTAQVFPKEAELIKQQPQLPPINLKRQSPKNACFGFEQWTRPEKGRQHQQSSSSSSSATAVAITSSSDPITYRPIFNRESNPSKTTITTLMILHPLDIFLDRILLFKTLPHTIQLLMPVRVCPKVLRGALTEVYGNHWCLPIQEKVKEKRLHNILYATINSDTKLFDLMGNLRFYTQIIQTTRIPATKPEHVDAPFSSKMTLLMAYEPLFRFHECAAVLDLSQQNVVATGSLENRIFLEKIPDFLILNLNRCSPTKKQRLRDLWEKDSFFTDFNVSSELPPYRLKSLVVDISDQPNLIVQWLLDYSTSPLITDEIVKFVDNEIINPLVSPPPPTFCILLYDIENMEWWYTDDRLLSHRWSCTTGWNSSPQQTTSSSHKNKSMNLIQQQQQSPILLPANDLIYALRELDDSVESNCHYLAQLERPLLDEHDEQENFIDNKEDIRNLIEIGVVTLVLEQEKKKID